MNRGAYESAISSQVVFSAAGVVNAASYTGGSVAPGELVTIFGTGFGADPIALASYDAAGYLPVEVGNTRVYFDGIAAPMIYSLSQQVSAIAPYQISGTTQVQVEYAGPAQLPVDHSGDDFSAGRLLLRGRYGPGRGRRYFPGWHYRLQCRSAGHTGQLSHHLPHWRRLDCRSRGPMVGSLWRPYFPRRPRP